MCELGSLTKLGVYTLDLLEGATCDLMLHLSFGLHQNFIMRT